MHYRYKVSGTCSREVEFDLENGIVSNVVFHGGCSGNTQGISKLAEGMKAEDIIERLENIRCGFKSTSCPDQFAKVLKKALNE